MRQNVDHVPSPEVMDCQTVAPMLSDFDIGCYARPEAGNNILIGSEYPDCDVLEWIADPDNFNKTSNL